MQTEKNDFAGYLEQMRAESAARRQETAMTCPVHGEITQGELDGYDGPYGQCPKCAEAEKLKVRQQRRESWVKHDSGIPQRFQGAGFANYKSTCPESKTILRVMSEYAQNFPKHKEAGRSLVLCGNTGTGKTHLACAALKHIILNHGGGGVYITAHNATGSIKATYSRNSEITEHEALLKLKHPPLLVLDEIGMQRGTDEESLLLFNILNGRYEEMRPTIVISNLTVEELQKYLGDRIYDRLRDNGGAVLSFQWKSWRQRSE